LRKKRKLKKRSQDPEKSGGEGMGQSFRIEEAGKKVKGRGETWKRKKTPGGPTRSPFVIPSVSKKKFKG